MPPPTPSPPSPPDLDVLILGAGWTATFLIPQLQAAQLSFAASTRDGRAVGGVDTIRWTFDPAAPPAQFRALPRARNVLVTFPLTGRGASAALVHGYTQAHRRPAPAPAPAADDADADRLFIQLGSTGIWQVPQKSAWTSRRSPYDGAGPRAVAEDELLALNHTVLNLAGLHGGGRDPRAWVARVARTKEHVRAKRSLHLIHGVDVARAVVAVTRNAGAARGQRWMLTDGVVYDWWELLVAWADGGAAEEDDPAREPSDQARWVGELMWEENVRALPRSAETLGRCYDSRDFWQTFGIVPLKARV